MKMEQQIGEGSLTNVDIAHRPSSSHIATPAAFEHLNKVLLSKSANSSLVLMNLPNIWGLSEEDCLSYVAYCDCLTQGLDKVIFAHGAGNVRARISSPYVRDHKHEKNSDWRQRICLGIEDPTGRRNEHGNEKSATVVSGNFMSGKRLGLGIFREGLDRL